MPRRLTRLSDTVVDPRQEWTRRKLQILLVAAALVGLALLGGGAWTVAAMLRAEPPGGSDSSRASAGDSPQDRIAKRPLPTAALEDAQPGPLATGDPGTLPVPAPTRAGPANVPTGFPHTPTGALAQLIAIDQAAIGSGSVAVAQSVIEAWAAPGGPTAETWTGVQAVAALLSAAGLPASASSTPGGLTVTVEPAMGFIKGRVGDDFVVPCVDLVVTASIRDAQTVGPHRVAAADCQRMVWAQDRWVIGPGAEPAPAPSVWPGTQASFDAGYLWLQETP